jgi:hypothetical protein
METYVAEINGEAVMAFRAEDDDHAYDIVNEKDGGLQLGLNGHSGLLRADGNVLWDEKTEIKARRATEAEHQEWLEARDAETGEGKQIDPSMDDDPDDFNVYLISVMSVDEEEDEDEDEDEADDDDDEDDDDDDDDEDDEEKEEKEKKG